jgi:hypothetical protein
MVVTSLPDPNYQLISFFGEPVSLHWLALLAAVFVLVSLAILHSVGRRRW